MQMFGYTFKTWALAQAVHPIVILIYSLFRTAGETGFDIGSLFLIFIVSFFASAPSLFSAWLLLYIISNTDLTTPEKFIAWLFSVPVAILLNFYFLKILTGDVLDQEMNEIIIPPLIAGVFVALTRVRSFFFFQTNYKTN